MAEDGASDAMNISTTGEGGPEITPSQVVQDIYEQQAQAYEQQKIKLEEMEKENALIKEKLALAEAAAKAVVEENTLAMADEVLTGGVSDGPPLISAENRSSSSKNGGVPDGSLPMKAEENAKKPTLSNRRGDKDKEENEANSRGKDRERSGRRKKNTRTDKESEALTPVQPQQLDQKLKEAAMRKRSKEDDSEDSEEEESPPNRKKKKRKKKKTRTVRPLVQGRIEKEASIAGEAHDKWSLIREPRVGL